MTQAATVLSKRVIQLHEREIRLFARSELFDSSGKSKLLTATRELAAIDLRDVADGVELRALGLVGYLPLTSDVVLNLRPKFPTGNLWRMLSLADEAYERILPVLREYERAQGEPPHQLLARGFCHFLKELLSAGIGRSYFQRDMTGYYKPKINFGKTVSKFLSKGDEVNVASDTFLFSSAIRANAILHSACIAFSKIAIAMPAWSEERRVLTDALDTLRRCPPIPMKVGDEALALNLPARLQRAYHGALSIYSMYLGYTKIGFSYDPSGRTLPSFLFKLDNIFESYVRNVARTGLRAAKISIADGNQPKNHVQLFADSKRFPAKPDIIFRADKRIIGIGEVKYKPKIEESDRYQLIAHVMASGAPKGVWISPVLAGETAGMTYVGTVTGAKFYHYTLDIGTHDLVAAEHRMADEIGALLITA